jgi:tetratricopeptide (TPR) repeat protein
MTISHKIDDFLFELFPGTKNHPDALKDATKRYYTIGPFEPTVTIEEDFIHIDIDTDRIQTDKEKFAILVTLAESEEFDQAKKYATELIEGAPHISEYHRILGQIYSETGDQEKAIDTLIDALKWNPKNEWALLMMGNIYAKHKNDVDTAQTFYEQILTFRPDDYLALNNIGAQLLSADNVEEALGYFQKAYAINSDYPNTLFAMASIELERDNPAKAFDTVTEALKKNPKQDELYQRSVNLAMEAAKAYMSQTDTGAVVDRFISELSEKTGKEIRKEVDNEISTAAKIEYAEVWNRSYHLIKYREKHPGIHHLILHELIHLELAEEARAEGSNKQFTSRPSFKESFMLHVKKDVEKLKKKGVPEANVQRYFTSIYDGMNLQIFNTPIDLFIEDRIYNRFEEIRPIQFRSLMANVYEGIESTTKKDVIKHVPAKILSASIVYNLVNSLHLKDLYGIDLIQKHNPKSSEISKAKEFYEEYQQYRADKNPAEEYELVQYWADDLNLSAYFELVDEAPSKTHTADTILDEIANDPYGLDTEDPAAERKMKQFLEHHADKDINQSVAMYMVSALQYFKDMPKEEVKKIAMDIATVGMTGIDPKKDGYHIPSIKGSSFSGYQTLAYYYVSWAIAIPEMLAQLEMPFDKEYEVARELINNL